MAITVFLFAKAKKGKDDALKSLITQCLPETRKYSGCISIDIYENDKQGGLVFYEKWETKADYHAYLNWRTEQGVMDEIGALLISPPDIQYYNHIDI